MYRSVNVRYPFMRYDYRNEIFIYIYSHIYTVVGTTLFLCVNTLCAAAACIRRTAGAHPIASQASARRSSDTSSRARHKVFVLLHTSTPCHSCHIVHESK